MVAVTLVAATSGLNSEVKGKSAIASDLAGFARKSLPLQKAVQRMTALKLAVCISNEVSISRNGNFIAMNTRDTSALSPLKVMVGGESAVVTWPTNESELFFWGLKSFSAQEYFVSEEKLLILSSDYKAPSLYQFDPKEKNWLLTPLPPETESLKSFPGFWNIAVSNYDLDNITRQPLDLNLIINRIPDSTKSRFTPSLALEGLVSLSVLRDSIVLIGQDENFKLKMAKFTPNTMDFTDISAPINRMGFPRLRAFETSEGVLGLADIGFIALLKGGRFETVKIPMYGRFIQTPFDAGPEILFGPNSIHSFSQSARDTSSIINAELARWVSSGWYIKSGSYDKSSGRIALLMKAGGIDDSALVFLNINGESSYISCTDRSFEKSSRPISFSDKLEKEHAPVPKYPLSFIEISDENDRIGIWTFQSKANSKGTIVSVRGGPTVSLYGDHISDFEARLLNKGFKIVKIEYSGAQQSSYDLFGRLAKDFSSSIETDAKIVTQYLKSINDQKPMFLLAYSFGSLLGAEISAQNPHIFRQTFLVAPFSSWQRFKKEDVANIPEVIKYSLVRDHLGFGSPLNIDHNQQLAFSAKIEAIVSKYCQVDNLKVLYGEFDEITPPKDWISGCRKEKKTEIFQHSGHGLSKGMANVIEAEVEKSLSKKPCARKGP
ncbi:alpha/beta hydrolase family protein [Candidatus Phycosocius spiralis]|uniref:Serine aminopeptidase S33 domain-containing protein n=1 Tax=Candidatus Phycosocius spiralis TaxID=2815099 RepID=A0ABQ4PWP4_9PROT|nr:hypothetical protein [Candidatus Phycosocius spiralis]GIU67098.1 hypothetical protein PsB1_1252 [Candidatus Phycosocius spiralis]